VTDPDTRQPSADSMIRMSHLETMKPLSSETEQVAPPPAEGARRFVKFSRGGVDLPTFVLHWGLVWAITISLLTGLRIASDFHPSAAGAVASRFLRLLPQGRVIEIHVAAGWAVSLIIVVYALYLWRGRFSARVSVRRIDLRKVLDTYRGGVVFSSLPFWSVLNRLVVLFGFLLVGVMSATGWMLYAGIHFGTAAFVVQTVHGVAALGIVAFALLHVLVVLRAGTVLKMFRPRLRYLALAGFPTAIGLLFLGATYLYDGNRHVRLGIVEVDEAPVIDGSGGDPAWDRAGGVSIHTSRGANLPNGEAVVEVRAVHHRGRVYFRFRWPDPQRSQKHLPLLKTEGGWMVLQSGYERNDVNDYYEDKFAVILSTRPLIASGTAHLGQDLIQGPHYPNSRGLHYSQDGTIVDLLHWKSIRSGGMTPGFVDDNHIGPPLPSEQPGARYTGGYTQDPPSSPHPYQLNWIRVDSSLPLDGNPVVPRYLPADPDLLAQLGRVDLDPRAHDDGRWFMTESEIVPYSAELDQYPIGTVLPGVVIFGSFEGDRGDVRGEALWADGFWTLEMHRALDTRSPFDVPIERGRSTFLWVAVFNHTQTRHSQHLHPVRLVLE